MSHDQHTRGLTDDGQPVVSDNEQVTRQQADVDAVDEIGAHDPSSSGATVWREQDGDVLHDVEPLRARASKRAWCIANDRPHPASAHYGYDMPSAMCERDRERVPSIVSLTYPSFTTPAYVTEDAVLDETLSHSVDGLGPFGGHRLLTLVAILDVWGLTNEEVWTNDVLRDEIRTEFENVQAKTTKVLRKAFELRRGPRGTER